MIKKLYNIMKSLDKDCAALWRIKVRVRVFAERKKELVDCEVNDRRG